MNTDTTVTIADVEVLADGLDHPECVAWDPHAGVLYAGGEAGQIYAIRDGEARQVADAGAFVLGIALDGDGFVYACAGTRVVRVDPRTNAVDVHTTGALARPLQAPNYPAFGADGALYVTDSGGWDGDCGCIQRVAPGGAAEVWTEQVSRFPNGCCLAPAGDALYVVESQGPAVWRVPIADRGSAGTAQLVCELPGAVPDGIAFDARGALYVSCYRPDRIYRLQAGAAPEVLVEDPYGVSLASPTNMAFFGAGLSRMATANLGRWHVSCVDVSVPGQPLQRPRLGAA